MPSRSDRPLAGRTVCVLSALVGGDYFGTLVTSVARATSALGGTCFAVQTQTTEFITLPEFDPNTVELKRLALERADAFVVSLRSVPIGFLEDIRCAGHPVVELSDVPVGFECPVVLPDNGSGARQAVLHLIRHGHSRIGFVGDLRAQDVQERYETYKQVLDEHGLPEFFFPAPGLTFDAGLVSGEAMAQAGFPCTAVFASCDHNAMGVMDAARRAGLRLPHDLAVVGFDDMPGPGLVDLPLTTVCQDFAGMGAEAVRLLTEELLGRHVEPGAYRVPTALVVRESCGCCETGPEVASVATPELVGTSFGLGASTVYGPEVDGVISRVESLMRTSATSGADDLVMIELEQAGQALVGLLPEGVAHSVLGWAHGVAAEIEAGTGGAALRPQVRTRLARCITELGVGMSRAAAMEGVERVRHLKGSAVQDYAVSAELLQGGRFDPRSLEWARHIGVGAALLALWHHEDRSGDEVLRTEGVYGPSTGWAPVPSSMCDAAQFPPLPMLERLAGPGRMWLLLPVRTAGHDWGYLAVLSDLQAIIVNQDRYFQWAAMLAQALDHHGLTLDLRRRNEELSESVEREHQMAQAVKESEERYAFAAQAVNDALWDWDVASGSVYFSPRWKAMLGERAEQVTAAPEEWLERVHPEDKPALTAALAKAAAGETATIEIEHRARAANGSYLWALCRALVVKGDDGRVSRLVGSFSDVTERRHLQDELMRQALYDNLTGLPNRALFLDRLSQAIVVSRRQPNNVFAVLWLDLDGFKRVNDTLGHLAGDQLLVQVAHRLSGHVRASDTAARFGGDEFAILLQYLPDELAALQVAARAKKDLSKPYDLGTETVCVTASIGISCSLTGYERAEDVIRDADIAMYRAKSSGRNQVVVYEPCLVTDAISSLHNQVALRRAMDEGQIEMAYQPVLSLSNGELWALEATPVWHSAPASADLGMACAASPGAVVPYDLELTTPLGRWAQREACRQLVGWKAARAIGPGAHVVLRLARADLVEPSTGRHVQEIVSATGAHPEWLWFEADHSAVIESLDSVLEVVRELPCAGLTLRMDDTQGRRWLVPALKRLPLSAIKMHRDLVAHLDEPERLAIARRIMDIAQKLDLPVVAEGVATPSAQRSLESLGCQFGQGYWFSKPLRGEEVTRALAPDPGAVVN